MHPHHETFVEQMGIEAEADGLPRIAGRLLALLLLSAEPRSLDDLTAELGVSKGSVSTDARRLLERGIVQRVARRGDRRDYYQLAPDAFPRMVRYRLGRWDRVHALVTALAAVDPAPSAVVAGRCAELDGLHRLLAMRVAEALAEWECGSATRARAAAATVGAA